MSDKRLVVTELLSAQIASLNTENAALRAEIDRLRDDLQKQADWADWAKGEMERQRERRTSVEAERDGAYGERNRVVAWAARMALALGFDVTVTKTAIHGWDAAWHNCIYVQTPEGQVSWHFHDQEVDVFADFPRGAVAWDGHSTPQKYDRVRTARYTNRAERIVELEAAVERVRALHVGKQAFYPNWDGAIVCGTCNRLFPCPTIRALEGTP